MIPAQSLSVPAWLRYLLRLAAVALGAVHTIVAILQQSMNEDGIGYLDMGEAWWRGDWEMAINGIWSPLYSWILGGVVTLAEPSIRWEFPAAQATNFFLYVVALVCFEYFWRQLGSRYFMETGPRQVALRPWMWWILGYSIFVWSSLNLIEIWAVTPDMTVSALVYLAAGLLIRLSRPGAAASSAFAFGAILGLGYLAKAAMMPLGIVCLLLTLLLQTDRSTRIGRFALATAGFALVAAPLVIALSLERGSPTFSDVSRFTYLKHVNEMRYPDFYEDLERLEGTPETPPARIFDSPPVYAFPEPVGGTYPMAYDPGYWTAGIEPTVAVGQQLRAIATNAMKYFELFVRKQGPFLAVVVLLLLTGPIFPIRPRLQAPESVLILWSLAALGMYSLVFVDYRYVAAFVTLFWAGWLACIRLPDAPRCRRLLDIGGGLLVLAVWINIGAQNLAGVAGIAGFSPLSESGSVTSEFSDGHPADHVAIAETLRDEGLRANDRIGFIGYSYSAYWARLADLRIVTEIYPDNTGEFWAGGIQVQVGVLQAMAGVGASAVVAEPPDIESTPAGWQPIGDTGYLFRRLDDAETAADADDAQRLSLDAAPGS